ncbi:four-carbon acid sugar kinase family protein [Agrobacterium tumefaciens]|uniref:four-carbon acid sugar kinase family protein n=1 Tax=Agrobacterium tumefaciens TaxID=358 RepID=UPI00287C8983|nr:four-carbon acid sugar kinase family protein [Agrobacterium tumefaciens]MDS7594495.1 four-carbon acid sugar kinase family protein [Agrobacterium tumefaciens]
MLAILADDLTGALDAAAPFAGRGLSTEIAITVDGIAAALQDHPDVLSIDLACRDGSVENARAITKQVIALLPKAARLFKKIDSRLKGHIAAELDETPFDLALVAPAIPEFERVVADGHVCGFGVPTPISIREKLGPHAEKSLIPDTITQQDITSALESPDTAGVDLLIGARGLAEALAQSMTGRSSAALTELPAGQALFVVGSRDPITLAQIDALRGLGGISHIEAPNGVTGSYPHTLPITLVQATPGGTECSSQEVSRQLALSVVPYMPGPATTLLLSGGATAEAVMHEMNVSRFRLLGECVPGLGVGQIDGRYVITKSGGFGHPDTLKNIAESILGRIG